MRSLYKVFATQWKKNTGKHQLDKTTAEPLASVCKRLSGSMEIGQWKNKAPINKEHGSWILFPFSPLQSTLSVFSCVQCFFLGYVFGDTAFALPHDLVMVSVHLVVEWTASPFDKFHCQQPCATVSCCFG